MLRLAPPAARLSRLRRAVILAVWAVSPLALSPLAAHAAPAAPGLIAVSPEQQVALGVRLAPVQAASAAALDLPARVVVPPGKQAVVAAPVAGMVEQVLVGVGDKVHRGQALIALRSPDVARLQRERRDAASQRELAQSQAQRDTTLANEGIIPAARLQQAQARLREADAMLSERSLALRMAGGDAGLDGAAHLAAPIAGVVAQAQALPGQRVDAAAPLLRIVASDAMSLELDATPEQAQGLQPGAAVTVADAQADGVLQSKAPALGAGQSVLLRARLVHPGSLQPGALVQARVQLPAQAGLWRVPTTALTRIGGQDVVLVAAPGGFRPQPVQLVARLNDALNVRGALHAGEQVAASAVVAIKAAAAGNRP